jgi:hypothetical protein
MHIQDGLREVIVPRYRGQAHGRPQRPAASDEVERLARGELITRITSRLSITTSLTVFETSESESDPARSFCAAKV